MFNKWGVLRDKRLFLGIGESERCKGKSQGVFETVLFLYIDQFIVLGTHKIHNFFLQQSYVLGEPQKENSKITFGFHEGRGNIFLVFLSICFFLNFHLDLKVVCSYGKTSLVTFFLYEVKDIFGTPTASSSYQLFFFFFLP